MIKLAYTYHDNKPLASNQFFSCYSYKLVCPTSYFLFSRLKTENSKEVYKNFSVLHIDLVEQLRVWFYSVSLLAIFFYKNRMLIHYSHPLYLNILAILRNKVPAAKLKDFEQLAFKIKDFKSEQPLKSSILKRSKPALM